MKLKEWAALWPYKITEYVNGGRSAPDSATQEKTRRLAWQLEDYRVSSVMAGTIWFSPKQKSEAL